MEGWLKLHRTITESAVFDDAEVLRVWIYLLCSAAICDHQRVCYGRVVNIKPGQLITGRKKASAELNMPENRIYRALNILKELGNITVETNNRFSLVTLVNWEKFQSLEEKTNSRTTTEQQQNNSGMTTDEQRANNGRTHNKNIKNIKKDNNIKKGESIRARGKYKNVFLTAQEYDDLYSRYPQECGSKIERFSKYIADTGKKYKSHYDTLLQWLNEDAAKDKSNFATDEFFDAALKRGREKFLE